MKKVIALVAALAMVVPVIGLKEIKYLKVFAPGMFGLAALGGGVHVDSAMPPEQRAALLLMLRQAAERIEQAYGGVHSRPVICACASEECFGSFGGGQQRAFSIGHLAIVLSPRGLTPPIVTHERSHAELSFRLDGGRGEPVPRWFDEGLAVAVSDEPTHSEARWQEIARDGRAYPALANLESRDEWDQAVRSYGDDVAGGRRKIVYATAGHEVRRWLRQVGPVGLKALIDRLREGQDFHAAYRDLEVGG